MPAEVAIRRSSRKNEDSFVGMKIEDGHVRLYIPEQYDLDDDDGHPLEYLDESAISYHRDELIGFLSSLSLSKKSRSWEEETDFQLSDDREFVFDSYIWILKDYLTNGFPFRFEKKQAIGGTGKICWKQTIQKLKPEVSNTNVVYLNIFREKNCAENDVVVEAYRYCLSESIRYAGWLFLLEKYPDEIWEFTELKKDEYLYEVKKRMDSTFEEVRKIRLLHMSNIIRSSSVGITNRTVEYGVDRFDHVFEEVINQLFGKGVDTSDYYPGADYHLLDPPGSFPSSKLRPDTIMIDDETVYILDSKFYRYGVTNSRSDLPPSNSIQKQMTYAEYVKQKCPYFKHIFNAFIIPTKNKESKAKWCGYAQSEWKNNDEEYQKIHIILVDLRSVMISWMRNDESYLKRQLMELIDWNRDRVLI